MTMTRATAAAAFTSTALVLTLGLTVGTAMGAQGGAERATTPRPSATTSEPGDSDDAPGRATKRPRPQPTSTPAPTARDRNVRVSIPAVAFTETVVVVNGRLRTPILLADPTVTGKVRVVGAGSCDDCRARLTQGVVTWLSCRMSSKDLRNARIVVTLSDGRRVTKSISRG